MPLAQLNGVRFDAIDMRSLMNASPRESDSGTVEFAAQTGLLFALATAKPGVIYGTANIQVVAKELVDNDEEVELFRLKLQLSLRFEMVDAEGDALGSGAADYLADDDNLNSLTLQAQPVLNEKINYILANAGLNVHPSYNAIQFRGKRRD